jgi:hypothetical protein
MTRMPGDKNKKIVHAGRVLPNFNSSKRFRVEFDYMLPAKNGKSSAFQVDVNKADVTILPTTDAKTFTNDKHFLSWSRVNCVVRIFPII